MYFHPEAWALLWTSVTAGVDTVVLEPVTTGSLSSKVSVRPALLFEFILNLEKI